MAAGVAAIGLAGPALGQELYLLEGGSEPVLVRVDGQTGEVLEESPVLGASYIYRGLALRWDGMLFAMDSGGLFKINPHTGEGEVVGPLGAQLFTIAADPNTGQLYGTSNEDLYQIDHKTGATTYIGRMDAPEMFAGAYAMAIGRDGYGYVTDRGYISLFRVNLATAEAVFICQLGSQIWYEDMAFDDDGMLWAIMAWDGVVRRSNIQMCQTEPLFEHYAGGIEVVPSGDGCYSDCNGDDALDLFDFLCFINAFNAEDEHAQCTGDGQFDLFDFLCFVNSFNAGC